MLSRGLRCLLPILAVSAVAFAQEGTSVILGIVTDPADAVVPHAAVTATETATGQSRSVTTDDAGRYRFDAIRPGTYKIHIQAQGFKAFDLTNIPLLSGETRDLGKNVLQVGQVTEEVSVEAQATAVQTASSERSSSVTPEQLQQLSTKGRDPFDMMHLLPGVVDSNLGHRDLENAYSMGSISINGMDPQSLNVAIDGVTEMDEGGNYTAYVTPNMDSIAEMRVLTNGYQAEYGRQSGGTINMISKGGSRDFHGSGHFDHRNEDLNANTFFNNRQGLQRPEYRYMIAGYSFGGPAYIPKHWNTGKNRLFFFISQEFTKISQATVSSLYNEPTPAMLTGDFSQARTSTGALLVVNDPNTGAPFPGNIIPQARIDPTGQALLALLPKPNGYVNPAPGQFYNYNFLASGTPPYTRRNTMMRFDAALTNKINMYYTYGQDVDNESYEFTNTPGTGTDNRFLPGYIHRVHLTDSINPTTVNEFSFGVGHDNYGFTPTQAGSQILRSSSLNPPALYTIPTGPQYQNLLPCANFAGGNLPNAGWYGYAQGNQPPAFGCGLIPYKNFNDGYVAQDDLSHIVGAHNLKFGGYFEWNSKVEPSAGGTYMGNFNFGSNTANPLDTNDGYANALLGIYQQYSQASNRAVPNIWWWNAEWYAQDSWHATKKLTIDYGVRFLHQRPTTDNAKYVSDFWPSLYNRSAAPTLYQQGSVAGKSASYNPLTGQYSYPSLIGTVIPGSGNYLNGMAVDGINGNGVFYTFPPVVVAPRLGFAYDPKGDGKMVIRASAGIFYNRTTDSLSGGGTAPVVYTPTLYYGTINTLAGSAQSAALSPIAASTYVQQRFNIEHVNAFNLTVQRDVGYNTVVDVAYVGSFDRDASGAPYAGSRQSYSLQLNPLPLGVYSNPANLFNNTEILANLLRTAYPGVGAITYSPFAFSGVNYNALQMGAQHRLSHGLAFGATFSFSKALGLQGADPYHTDSFYYGPVQTDRKAILTWNFSYLLPSPTSEKVIKSVLGGWTLAGVGNFTTGAPVTPYCSSTAAFPYSDPAETGTGFGTSASTLANGGVRCEVTGNPNAVSKNFYNQFNTSAFALAPIGTFGNVGLGTLFQPSWWNFDASLDKQIQVKERMKIHLRFQAFNVFNHTEFNTMDSTFKWNAANVNQDTTTGQFTNTQPQRIMALTARVEF
ncbi:MAG TPA: carboxypeptidase regulatory-like domain-containing protein [Bryobacteraceae bacterium]|nr:carboxypeptidase regulatory-like domain-containing protein [Bryobacteraceae bacterium]